MSSKHKRKGVSKFLKLDGYMIRCTAWKTLTPVERAVYLEVKWRYDGRNNGRIGLGVRELAEAICMGRSTAALALDALQEKGFITKTKPSAFNVKNRAVTEWRLTEATCDVTGELPTKDFMRWGLEKKQQSYPPDTQSYPPDTTGSKKGKNTSHSPTCRTVKPNIQLSQSYPPDTYRSTIRGANNAA